MKNFPTPKLAPIPSHSALAATFTVLMVALLVGAWLGWVYWSSNSNVQNAKNFAEAQIAKERAFTARLEAQERGPTPLRSEPRPVGSMPIIDPDVSSASKPTT